MADDGSKIPSPFDVQTIKNLVGLMSRHDLSEIDLREGEVRIRLRRGPQGTVVSGSSGAIVPMVVPPQPPSTAPPAATSHPESPKPSKTGVTIKSPTPGTFYTAASPDVPPFVKVGSRVTPTTVVCIIEAMKIFNEIPADCTGVITDILVENQQAVEFGQVLFKVDPAG